MHAFSGAEFAFKFRTRHTAVIGTILLNIGLLGYYKYINFFIAQWNTLAESAGFAHPVAWDSVALPIGISFFTFHSMSYVFDVAMRRCEPQKSLTRYALYITCFPQLIAGPIVRYHDISDQLPEREHTMSLFYEGVVRFLHGLAKKVVIADALGAVADAAFNLPAGEMTTSAAWIGAFAYTMQIYFDFSAYSDMAIGLAKMFGLTFPENFRRPYSALSITDFWRRWHITLSNWIREYLYIPLGGSRVSRPKMYRNLIIAFFLTGLWHGANWTFIVWGIYHGTLLIIERVLNLRRSTFLTSDIGVHVTYESNVPRVWVDGPQIQQVVLNLRDIETPGHIIAHAPLRRAITLFLVLIGWVMFRAVDMDQAMLFYHHMAGANWAAELPVDVASALNHRNVLTLLLASLVFIMPERWQAARFLTGTHRVAECYRWFLLLVALPVVIILVVAGTYSPFLYFQF